MSETQLILACDCVHREIIPRAVKQQVLDGLRAAGMRVTVVEDLCGRAVGKDPVLTALATAVNPVVLACHPRAVRELLHFAGVHPLPASLRILNLRTQTAEAILGQLKLPPSVPQPAPFPPVTHSPETATPSAIPADPWIPWFPVIDHDRCTKCRQCVSFCPFGVYTVEEDRVLVTAPRHCKDNCPACARMCPQQAIIFPKVGESPIDGSEVSDEALQAARLRHTARESNLAGGDIHAVLAKRKLRMKAPP
jgi:Pyruvate/2-oxoacid:ferredoxin oxidoreductase delta subunit